ncbi:hypothetical protein [Paraburkholderia domus]|uniref:hypothetical protein n=1 Tax=Paraburkholderia domus TaxID=2793075 RepID=UPI001B272CD9|nr:hypothetical protein [Paraburkholderia domus]CAE6835275.1 hypothetical protein R75483_06888 [Paraburkholderia domus]
MARRIQLALGTGLSAGQGPAMDWPGGEGMLAVSAASWSSGTVRLQQMGPDGNWYTLQNEKTITPISITANGTANFMAPAGKVSLLVAGASGVSGWAVGIPSNVAG